MNLLKDFEGKRIEFELNGHKVEGVISILWDYDSSPIEDQFDYGSTEANRLEVERFRMGELLSLVVSVVIRAEGLEGIDTLGQVWIKAQSWSQEIQEVVEFHEMVETALEDLKFNIEHASSKLAKYAPKVG